jgi:hypothetical protein
VNALRELLFFSTKKSYPASTNRRRLPVVASGMYARSPMLRNRPIWMPPKKEIGTTTKRCGSVAGRNPNPARTAAWLAIVHRSGCATTLSTRPDLICDDSTTPAMKANIGHNRDSESPHCLSDKL